MSKKLQRRTLSHISRRERRGIQCPALSTDDIRLLILANYMASRGGVRDQSPQRVTDVGAVAADKNSIAQFLMITALLTIFLRAVRRRRLRGPSTSGAPVAFFAALAKSLAVLTGGDKKHGDQTRSRARAVGSPSPAIGSVTSSQARIACGVCNRGALVLTDVPRIERGSERGQVSQGGMLVQVSETVSSDRTERDAILPAKAIV